MDSKEEGTSLTIDDPKHPMHWLAGGPRGATITVAERKIFERLTEPQIFEKDNFAEESYDITLRVPWVWIARQNGWTWRWQLFRFLIRFAWRASRETYRADPQ